MEALRIEMLTRGYKNEGLTERQIKNRLAKEEIKEQAEKTQKQIKSMTITVEWKKSATWGQCPTAKAHIQYADGTFGNSSSYYAKGCGYCKESTVIANIFNEVLKYKLWEVEENTNTPYGVRISKEFNRYFEGGVGVSCYRNITEFFGGKFENTSNGKSFSVYTVEF